MKKAVFAKSLSFIFVVLFAFFIGSGIRQSASVKIDNVSGANNREVYTFITETEQTDGRLPENSDINVSSGEPLSSEKFSNETDNAYENEEAASTEKAEIPVHNDDAENKTKIDNAQSTSEINVTALSRETVVDARFGTPYKYRLDTASSVIIFNIKVTERGALSYTFSPVGTSLGNWNAELFGEYYINGSGETALRSLNVLSVSASDGASPNIGLMPGNYVLKVTAGKIFSDAFFSINIGFSPSTEYEIEYNDSVTRYTEIYPGVPIKGSASYYLSGQDSDWFMFRNSSDAYFSLSFAHEELSQSTVAFKVSLYNSDMIELYSGNSLLSSRLISSENLGLPEGIYFISVVSRVYTGVDYTLLLERRSSYNFETENNDSASSADIILQGVPVRGALSSRSGVSDKDFFSFTLENSGYINAELKNIEPVSSFKGYVRRISLNDSFGNTIYSSLIADNAQSVLSPSIGLAAGTYYIIIDDSDLYHSASDYELSFSFTETNGWEKEYNNTPLLATPIYEDIPISGTISDAGTDFDTDYFVISAEKVGKMTVNFSHAAGISSRETFRISVYNQKMEQVGSVLSSYDNTVSVSGDFDIMPGTYFIKVTSGSYSSDMRYYLTCSFQEAV